MSDAEEYRVEMRRLIQNLHAMETYPRSASWLASDFDQDIWDLALCRTESIRVDFSIALDDGSLLTDAKNQETLLYIKASICSQSEEWSNDNRPVSLDLQRRRVRYYLTLVDYFLLRSRQFRIGEYGFGFVTENDIRQLFRLLVSNCRPFNGVYNWPQNFRQFLEDGSRNIDLSAILADAPQLMNFEVSEPWMLGIEDPDRILRYRAYLWSSGLYRGEAFDLARKGSKYVPATRVISARLYKNTLAGRRTFPVPKELTVGGREGIAREFSSVDVVGVSEGTMGSRDLYNYKSALYRCSGLHRLEAGFTQEVISAVPKIAAQAKHFTKELGRFTTIPPGIVLEALKDSIEFFLQFGDGIVSTYLSFAARLTKRGYKTVMWPLLQESPTLICPSLTAFDIQHWVLPSIFDETGEVVAGSRSKYFSDIRAGKSFWHLVMVFYGSITITLGSLMARRVCELRSLRAEDCLDESGRYLIFRNAKSGGKGMRDTEARPIPEICVRMIRSIQRLQAGMRDLGIGGEFEGLLSYPKRRRLSLTSSAGSLPDKAIDIFCDFFQVARNEQGQRYYFRTHQLRRFFAMAFFWSGTAAGPDTLRWFMGHTDLRHLHHYITESTPGRVLVSVKASIGAELVRRNDSAALALSHLCQQKFGTSNFMVLKTREVEDYVEELMLDGAVTLEPEFFSDASGERFTIVIRVLEGLNATAPN